MDRNLWESSRLQGYITAQVNSKNKISQQDICKFNWENEPEEMHITEISNEDISRLKNLSTKFNNCTWEKIN